MRGNTIIALRRKSLASSSILPRAELIGFYTTTHRSEIYQSLPASNRSIDLSPILPPMNHVAAVMIFLLLMTAVKNSWGFHSNHHHVLNHILHQRSESMATTTAIKQRSYWLPATTRDDHYSQNNKETQTKSFTKRNGPKGNERQIISLRKQKDLGTILGNLRQGKEIDDWMKELVKQKQQQKETYFPKEWTSRDETDFIRILRDFRAYEAIELFVRHFARQNVYVYTAGMSALANAKKDPIRTRAILLLDAMDEAYVLPSSFTYAALFRSMDGPTEAKKLMTRLQTYKSKKVPWSVEAFNQAIMACSRRSRSSGKKASSSNSNYNATNHHQSWQVALEFFHSMRREGLVPNLQTFTHLLYVCGQTGQVRIALSLLQELQNTPGLEPNGKVWGALLSVFAQSGDYKQANKILKKMQDSGCNINLVHCSAFLKALSRVGEVYWSFRVLDMMTGALNTESAENAESETNDSSFEVVQLPTVTPDLVGGYLSVLGVL